MPFKTRQNLANEKAHMGLTTAIKHSCFVIRRNSEMELGPNSTKHTRARVWYTNLFVRLTGILYHQVLHRIYRFSCFKEFDRVWVDGTNKSKNGMNIRVLLNHIHTFCLCVMSFEMKAKCAHFSVRDVILFGTRRDQKSFQRLRKTLRRPNHGVYVFKSLAVDLGADVSDTWNPLEFSTWTSLNKSKRHTSFDTWRSSITKRLQVLCWCSKQHTVYLRKEEHTEICVSKSSKNEAFSVIEIKTIILV